LSCRGRSNILRAVGTLHQDESNSGVIVTWILGILENQAVVRCVVGEENHTDTKSLSMVDVEAVAMDHASIVACDSYRPFRTEAAMVERGVAFAIVD
jgi:hypothetical protein